MRISLIPQRRDDTLSVIKAGEILTINGDPFDFSVIPDGATLPAIAVGNEFVINTVERIDGELHLALFLPVGPNASQEAAHPSDIIDPPDGPLRLPTDPKEV